VARDGSPNGDEHLAALVAAGQTLTDAAASAGVSRRTATRRAADPAFRALVQRLRGDMVAQALGRMASHMAQAADTLHALLAAESDSVKLGAARSLLELGVKLRDSVELEQRLADLEARLSGESDNAES
jgi:hypothetical protein